MSSSLKFIPPNVRRVETAAGDVIRYTQRGESAKARAEIATLRTLAHSSAATHLAMAGVPQSAIRALQQRADRLEKLFRSGASTLTVSLAANHVSQLMPGFHAGYRDPVPPAVLHLDYIGRQIQLGSMAGKPGQVRRLVKLGSATWTKLRPRLVAAGGARVARDYDAHLDALERQKEPTAVQAHALQGLDLVAQMETTFLRT